MKSVICLKLHLRTLRDIKSYFLFNQNHRCFLKGLQQSKKVALPINQQEETSSKVCDKRDMFRSTCSEHQNTIRHKHRVSYLFLPSVHQSYFHLVINEFHCFSALFVTNHFGNWVKIVIGWQPQFKM